MTKNLFSKWLIATSLTAFVSIPALANDISDVTAAFSVGISNSGNLYDGTGTGFRRNSDGFDPLIPGTPRDSWGVSANGIGGYGDPFNFGVFNLVLNGSSLFGANSAFTSNFLNDGSSNLLRVDQTYTFSADNILQIATVVTNVSGSAQAVLFQRNVDWDFPSIAFQNFTKADAFGGFVVDASAYGFEDPNPTTSYTSSTGAGGGTFGAGDLGGGIKLDLGLLADGNSTSFNFLYGISREGQAPSALNAQAAALGASFLVTSYSTDGDFDTATQSSILGVGIDATATPEPGSLALLATGLGLLGYRLRRRAA